MEKRLLLGDRPSYAATSDSKSKRPSLQPSISYEQLPPSIASYFGENYHCVITPPRHPPDNQNIPKCASESESSGNSHTTNPKKHRPYFIYLVTLVDMVMVAYSCMVGGIQSIGLVSHYQHKTVPRFGYIHKAKKNQTLENFGIYPGKNLFIGPNVSILVRLGALYPPCMREDSGISKRIDYQKKTEKNFSCCSLNGECSMMNDESCISLSGQNIGNATKCLSSNSKCKNGVTLRPCCIGVHAKCLILSQKKCEILKGRWHKNKLLCGDVNCLDSICGMSGAHQTHGHQFYRIFTPIFLHIGILHLLTNLVFQIFIGSKIEREIGTTLTATIYMVSGIGANLFSGIFTPLIPQVGASGALYGLMGLILVYYVQNYSRLRRPRLYLCLIIGTILLSFALGTIPYIGNFVHLGGFVFGLLITIVVSKKRFRTHADTSCHPYMWKVVCIIFLVSLTVSSFTIFYTYEHEFCPKCKYFDCIPYTPNFCPDMSSDGILNADYENS